MGFPRGCHRTKGDSFSSDTKSRASQAPSSLTRSPTTTIRTGSGGCTPARASIGARNHASPIRARHRRVASFISQLERARRNRRSPRFTRFAPPSTSPLMSCSTTTNRWHRRPRRHNGRTDAAHNNWLNAEESAAPRPEVVFVTKRDITGRATERAQGAVLDSGVTWES